MDRRAALKRVSLMMGGAITASFATAVLNGCAPDTTTPDGVWVPSFLDSLEDSDLVAEIAERIMPETDTPGAKTAMVNRYIDAMLNDCTDEEVQQQFRDSLKSFKKNCKSEMGNTFENLNNEEKDEFMRKVYATDKEFFLGMKQLTLLGFFRTEVGMTQVQQYKAIPGAYNGCVTLEEAGGRAWASYY